MQDVDLLENMQNLLIAVVARAIDDVVVWRTQEYYFPPDENGNPPETFHKDLTPIIDRNVKKINYPHKIKNGNNYMVFETAEQHKKHLAERGKARGTVRYFNNIKEGKDALRFLTNPERISAFTTFSPNDLMWMIDKKMKIIKERVSKGESPYGLVSKKK